MRITNKTKYESAPLIELARRVAEVELDPEKRKVMRVDFVQTVRGISKGGYVGLCHRIGGNHVDIIVPANPKKVSAAHIAAVLAHEYAHARGMRHRGPNGMGRNPRYRWVKGWRDTVTSYIDGIVIKPREKKVVKLEDDDKLARAQARLLVWEKKRRRCETGIKTWKRRVRYYEKKVAAARANKLESANREPLA